MRPYTVHGFQMLCMHQQACKFITVFVQPEKHTDSHIVNSALHGSVHRFGMIIIVVLRPCRVKNFIVLFMIGFLKQNIGADSGILKLSVIFNRGCSNIYIHTADCAVFMLYGINGFDAVKYIFNRVVDRVLPCFNGKTLMTHILKCNNLFCNFLLCKLFSGNMLVLCMIRTVKTAVYTVIGKIKRCKHNNAISVKVFFNLLGKIINFFDFLFILTGKKHTCRSVGKAFSFPCLIQNFINKL